MTGIGIGVSDFKAIRIRNNYYIDKSMYIKKYLYYLQEVRLIQLILLLRIRMKITVRMQLYLYRHLTRGKIVVQFAKR